MNKFFKLLKTWKLPVAMIIGALLYYLLEWIIPVGEVRDGTYTVITHYVQPTFIFCMLLLSFVKVAPQDLKPHRWHGILLLTQGALFVVFSLLAEASKTYFMQLPFADIIGEVPTLLVFEGAMLCFICPTATASAVIVQKLGGSLSGDVTYIVLCNLMVSLLAPGFLTLVEPHAGFDFSTEFFMIMGKVFPLLLCPLFVAQAIRHYTPRLMDKMLAIPDLAFYLWLVSLALAIMVTVRTIDECNASVALLGSLAIVSAISCVVQFWLGRKIGTRWPQPTKDPSQWKTAVYNPATYVDMVSRSAITAGQAFGQKNTVFIIWMGLVFLNPITSVVGGFYSLWHNIINSWQLYKKGKS